MPFPKTFDAYVPSNGPDFFALSNITAEYVPFEILKAVPIDPAAHAATYEYSKRLTPPAIFAHVIRCLYFALALLYTGFPSGTPGVAQIGFEELTLRLYHTALIHDITWGNSTEITEHPAHAMSFELQGGFMAYEHLHSAAPYLDAQQVGDIVTGIVFHTSQWSSGNSSANQILMSLSALFDVGGYNGSGLVGLGFDKLWHPQTIAEIEQAYPRAEFYDGALAEFDREFVQKPNCLLSHYPGGLTGLLNDLDPNPIVPVGSSKN
ncbi:hypothetical protein C8R47DRAFT_33528 [Mycena vitilis]|nr:hypothetical protein C8R47DRAFT_33528 [Mycena vitilis]